MHNTHQSARWMQRSLTTAGERRPKLCDKAPPPLIKFVTGFIARGFCWHPGRSQAHYPQLNLRLTEFLFSHPTFSRVSPTARRPHLQHTTRGITMATGPLNADEIEWMEDVLMEHDSEDGLIDISELDGLFTAALSSPSPLALDALKPVIWGETAPEWDDPADEQRFNSLAAQMMNDIAERLSRYPEQFEPLFGYREMDGRELLVVEEWCFGYMTGVALAEWPALPAELQPSLQAIALHGDVDEVEKLDGMDEIAYLQSTDEIQPAALRLYNHWHGNTSAIH